ncbi:hypothetical protein HanRHA438_Chr03g0127661 [Helianthus annuus]|nr:hypothetical protein HanHA300_Chr03g0096751 [Helianthus annuus]KAJ0601290.1 hypothetical protein HanIR_Chr03g0126671 [Helianthus annuus]KAJ0608429.1 hypothetical protein HanHA89_Chr03g0108441 [Helianthus annuus]KAJ0768492.1 hypothetical protein HanLR1_Chr03g0101801 [Helianthus annuus]KAJ0936160.1 hypothetical protein HanRHA438_Chr03g0127661 [Helianthus annuus]
MIFSLQNLFHFFFMFFTLFTSKAFSILSQPISYSAHCNSYVPEAIPTDTIFTSFSLLEPATSVYTGGQNILYQDPPLQWSILFQPSDDLFGTNVLDTYKIQAQLRFYSSYTYDLPSNFTNIMSNYSRHSLEFNLDGFWSASTSKLCMVGSARWLTKQGNPLTLNAILKFKLAHIINLDNSLVSGTLESLASPNDFDYFGPISILGFPVVDPLKYKYTLESNQDSCNVTVFNAKTMQDSVTNIKSLDICSIFTQRFTTYKLEYPSNCKNCSLFGQDHGNLPAFVSLYAIQCSQEDYKLRFIFSRYKLYSI